MTVSLFWKWMSMLFAELAWFTYTFNLLISEGREFDEDPFRLHPLKLLEIDVADYLVSQFYVCVRFETFHIHSQFYLFRIKDVHAAFSSSSSYESALFFNEPLWFKRSSMPHCKIWPTETKFFVIVGLRKKLLMYVLLPSFPNGTLPTGQIGCIVSSLVST